MNHICILGAESTGKTTLAETLARHFDVPWVPEYLRDFCNTNGRTPQHAEQLLILETQVLLEKVAIRMAEKNGSKRVIYDTAPLLTAVYSDYIFSDISLYERAISHHRNYTVTLLLEPDLPWVGDGIQRDGEHVREPITQMIRNQLDANDLPYIVINGSGEKRSRDAISAIKAIEQIKA
jgi:nicotinamide riboside kinase